MKTGIILIIRLKKKCKLEENRLKLMNARITYTTTTAIRKYHKPFIFLNLFLISILNIT